MSCCLHCGTQHAALKHCLRCKQASYYGAACQNAAWKAPFLACDAKSLEVAYSLLEVCVSVRGKDLDFRIEGVRIEGLRTRAMIMKTWYASPEQIGLNTESTE
jgi:hypothetical protein